MTLKQTPSQTVGPYFAYGLTAEQYGYSNTQIASGRMADDGVPGERIRIVGTVWDGAQAPVPDAMIELWQADGQGRIPRAGDGGNAGFTGFGRQGTGSDVAGRFAFDTIRPGRVDAEQAPHIVVVVFLRGLLTHLYTRIYFEDAAAANLADPVLQSVPEDRRGSLIATRLAGPASAGAAVDYQFDIHLQGERETVFFDV